MGRRNGMGGEERRGCEGGGCDIFRPAAPAAEPLFSFGVIADVQYADIPDGRSFLGVPRYYRHSLAVLRRAVQSWNASPNVRFCLNFGDIVDGLCPKHLSLHTIRAVTREFDAFRNGPAYHMLGIHCLYNLPRGDLVAELRMPSPPGRAYYDFSPCPRWRFVVLDAYDFSANSPAGLAGEDRRFVAFNGGVGDAQLRWLGAVLRGAARRGERVVVCSHLPVCPAAASPTGLMWNYGEVMDVVRRHEGCVVAWLAGHDHRGGYAVDEWGVHHRTLEAALECPPGTDAFGRVEVYTDRLRLVGSGRMPSTEMMFSFSSSTEIAASAA
ncbi:hypothetical protein HU200_011772 [Digitaria exilis]|uniref:Manganese-dependent ADP-ribose/CDP-alcohol diphosphatase n=1 Tax=Digitaria exilis TaxID=1010633 RepID=A0A835FGU6_9POAL|nr:hypothetical protein HU200_011772 [Digitaria exilis]